MLAAVDEPLSVKVRHELRSGPLLHGDTRVFPEGALKEAVKAFERKRQEQFNVQFNRPDIANVAFLHASSRENSQDHRATDKRDRRKKLTSRIEARREKILTTPEAGRSAGITRNDNYRGVILPAVL